jgi:hypothetical protein
VPFIIYDPNNPSIVNITLDMNPSNGLSKIAGTVLDIMDIPGMTHNFDSLIVK